MTPVPLEIPVELSREEAQQLAQAELQKGKYTDPWAWFTDLIRWLDRMLNDLLSFTDPTRLEQSSGSVVAWIVIGVLLVGVIILVWRVGIPRLTASRDKVVETEAHLSPVDYRSRAEDAASKGDWIGAVTERFRAMVRDLEDRTLLQRRIGRTATEVATLAGRAVPSQATNLSATATFFNDVLYGDHPADRDAWLWFDGLCQQVETGLSGADLLGVPTEAEGVRP